MAAKLAILSDFSFNFENNEKSLSKETIFEYLNNKVEFVEFNGTKNLMEYIHSILGNQILEVLNCTYTKTELIQAFYVDNNSEETYKKIIMVKRLLSDSDTYTYVDFNPTENKDPYVHIDMTNDDIYGIIRSKYIHRGVCVKANGEIREIEYIDKGCENGSIGKINVLGVGSKKYINVKNVVNDMGNTEGDQQENKLNVLIEDMLKLPENEDTTHIYSQSDISVGLLNCYYEMFGINKNKFVSELLNIEVYGDVIIGLENSLNSDTRILSLTTSLFENLCKFIRDADKNFKMKNQNICNIYYEFS